MFSVNRSFGFSQGLRPRLSGQLRDSGDTSWAKSALILLTGLMGKAPPPVPGPWPGLIVRRAGPKNLPAVTAGSDGAHLRGLSGCPWGSGSWMANLLKLLVFGPPLQLELCLWELSCNRRHPIHPPPPILCIPGVPGIRGSGPKLGHPTAVTQWEEADNCQKGPVGDTAVKGNGYFSATSVDFKK